MPPRDWAFHAFLALCDLIGPEPSIALTLLGSLTACALLLMVLWVVIQWTITDIVCWWIERR